jgi:hypothetical protein
MFKSYQPTAGYLETPQTLPVLQDEAELALKENALPEVFEAKVEIFFLI